MAAARAEVRRWDARRSVRERGYGPSPSGTASGPFCTRGTLSGPARSRSGFPAPSHVVLVLRSPVRESHAFLAAELAMHQITSHSSMSAYQEYTSPASPREITVRISARSFSSTVIGKGVGAVAVEP